MDYQNARIAEIYDLINPRAKDADFFISLAGARPIRVLDLGCGTGTLCCALAELGHRVTGVDPAAAMLDVARRKPCAQQVEWVDCSAQEYRTPKRFDLIVMTGHAFQTLLTDEDALAIFQTMRVHLGEGGKAAFETRNPRVDWASEWAHRPPMIRMLPGGQLVETFNVTDHNDEFISFQTMYQLPNESVTTNSTLWFPTRERVESLIAHSGLVVRNLFGDWEQKRFEEERSRELIFVAQRASE